MTSAAFKRVASSFSLNMSLNLDRMPSGGPPSIMFRNSSGSPTDISCAREGGLDKATYVASHRSSSEKKRGNFQWKIKPGSVVTPCSVWIVLAVLIVMGSCRLCTWIVYAQFPLGSCTSTGKLRRESCGSTAIHPARKSQFVQSRQAPVVA